MLLHRVGRVSVAKRKANVFDDQRRLGFAAADGRGIQAGFAYDSHAARTKTDDL
jgi:hypothetical protein